MTKKPNQQGGGGGDVTSDSSTSMSNVNPRDISPTAHPGEIIYLKIKARKRDGLLYCMYQQSSAYSHIVVKMLVVVLLRRLPNRLFLRTVKIQITMLLKDLKELKEIALG